MPFGVLILQGDKKYKTPDDIFLKPYIRSVFYKHEHRNIFSGSKFQKINSSREFTDINQLFYIIYRSMDDNFSGDICNRSGRIFNYTF